MQYLIYYAHILTYGPPWLFLSIKLLLLLLLRHAQLGPLALSMEICKLSTLGV